MYKKLQRFLFPERPCWYLIRKAQDGTRLSWHDLEPMSLLDSPSISHFYVQAEPGTLFKLVRDKYSPKEHFWRWLGRDIISKRLAGSYDARKEFTSRRILKQLGQHTVEVRCYGVALNFLNPLGSLYAMEHMQDCVTGSAYFEALDEAGRYAFIETLSLQIIQLAEAGYYHRDLHLDNLLMDNQQRLIWIDTHIKALPASSQKRTALLENMLTNSRIENAAYRAQLHERLEPYF